MNTAERNARLAEFEKEKREEGVGLLITTENLEDGERNAFHLGPKGDYCLQVGPEFEASTTEYSNGTTVITIKRAPIQREVRR